MWIRWIRIRIRNTAPNNDTYPGGVLMMGEKRTESLLVALAVSGVLVFSLTPSPLLRFGVSRLPALHRICQHQGIDVFVQLSRPRLCT
jgi:hypothetical protein